MAKVKYGVSKEAVEQAEKGGGGEQPPVGVYTLKIEECNHGFSKGEDGQPDQSRPRLEVIYRPVGDAEGNDLEKNYSRVWDYVSFSEAAEWKLAQFLLSIGKIDTKKQAKTHKGELDTDEAVGKLVKGRIRADTDLQDNYRARIASTFPIDGDAAGEDDDDLELDEDEDEDEETEESAADGLSAEDIDGMKSADLKELVSNLRDEGREIEIPKGAKVKQVRDILKDELFSGEEEEDEDDDDLPF